MFKIHWVFQSFSHYENHRHFENLWKELPNFCIFLTLIFIQNVAKIKIFQNTLFKIISFLWIDFSAHFFGKMALKKIQDGIRWFWITLPKSHFTEFFWPNVIWPKHHLTEHRLTEHHLTERPFNRNTIWPNAVWPKVHFTEKSHLAENKTYQKVVWPIFFGKGSFDRKSNLKNLSNDRNDIWPKVHLTESFFRKNGHFTERSFDRMFFFKWSFDRKYFFSKKFYLTDCSYSVRILCVLNFFVAARRRASDDKIKFSSIFQFLDISL
jgi:hypothetical protein